MENIIIFGASGHAKVTIDIFERLGGYRILGILDSNKSRGQEIFGYLILGDENHIPTLLRNHPDVKFFVAIGDNWNRQIIVSKIRSYAPSTKFASAIHPSAIIGKNVHLGEGIAIMPGVVINSESYIGDFTIVNTKSSVGHECRLARYSSLAPNATLGGDVTIGDFSAVLISSTLVNGIQIGVHSVIGAGTLVLKNVGDFTVFYGSPGKVVRQREVGDRYL